jgi:hypothetical protein
MVQTSQFPTFFPNCNQQGVSWTNPLARHRDIWWECRLYRMYTNYLSPSTPVSLHLWSLSSFFDLSPSAPISLAHNPHAPVVESSIQGADHVVDAPWAQGCLTRLIILWTWRAEGQPPPCPTGTAPPTTDRSPPNQRTRSSCVVFIHDDIYEFCRLKYKT